MALAADHPDLVGPLVIVDGMPVPRGPEHAGEERRGGAAAIAKMEAYMSTMTQEQWDAYATVWRQHALHGHECDRRRDAGPSGAQPPIAIRSLARSPRRTASICGRRSPGSRRLCWCSARGAAGTTSWRRTRSTSRRRRSWSSFAEQFARLPRLHFALHDTARHFIMWDDPAWFFGQIDAFLADPIAATRDRGLAA